MPPDIAFRLRRSQVCLLLHITPEQYGEMDPRDTADILTTHYLTRELERPDPMMPPH